MSERLTVHQDGNAIYDILIEPEFDCLGKATADALDIRNHKICIVTDSNVAPLYADTVKKQLESCCSRVDIYIFPAGEEYKNLDVVRRIYEYLILNHYDRGDCLAALGGGVTGDLCGFTAATYLRGISFIQIPTTLLSQVDSSIGGKTGVDFDAYKNMVGAFHMPSLVYICTSTLKTLDDEQFACGMGEIIKHGLIRDSAYFEWLGQNTDAINARDLQLCEQMILVSDNIKRVVVEKDPTEKGDRAFLNFGHTLGHAIEKLMNFKLYHGQCVALGCVAAAYLSASRGNLTMAEVESIREMMLRFHLPVDLTAFHLEPEKIVAATKNDKKMESGKIKFVLLSRIGDAYIDRTISDAEMINALRWIGGGAHEV
ncbi:MAG: 3-dehydroquinate synthase [Clostridiales bacterium]|nr:3-dehydroquinate synthase [Clostridiales bacterium]